MALVKLFIVVAVLVVVSALQAPIQQAPPPKCCFADQFEMDSAQMSSNNLDKRHDVKRVSAKLVFDYTNKRLAALFMDYSEDNITQSRFIVNHNEGYMYAIDDEAKSCEEIPGTPTDMMHCIPEDAILQRTAYLGNNTSRIAADNFKYHQKWPSAGMMTTRVTRGDCIQLSTTFIGDNGKMFNSAEYVNYVKGINNRSAYFDVPSYCGPQSKSRRRLTPNEILKFDQLLDME